MTRAEERAMIERAIAGDRAAAEECIRAHQASLYAYMLRLSGRPDVAEDIVQDAFVRALTNLDRFDFRFRFSTWLFTIAKRLYVNACQKHKPAFDSEIVDLSVGRGARPFEPMLDREAQDSTSEAVRHALGALPVEQREIIILFYQLEWPITLIAEYMNMPEGTVKSHLHRSRRRMREALELHEGHIANLEEMWS